MDKKRRRIILCALLCLVAGLFSACAETLPEQTTPIEETQVSNFPAQLQPYLSPWELDAAAYAAESRTIHYYFMSARGMTVDLTEEDPKKWGDACLVVFPNGETMLIDSGKEGYAEVLVENLRRLGVEKLDYILFSHSHNDHCFGALTEGGVLDSFPVGKIYWTGVKNTDWTEAYNIETACEKRGIELQIIRREDILSFGDVTMEVLWPMEGAEYMSDLRISNHNNQSAVIRFDYMDHSSLFPGDLYTRGEGDLATMSPERLDVDLLKASHHGQTTSNTEEFINAVSPKVAVATGYLPIAEKVKKRYEAVEAILLNDMEHGYIHVWSDGSTLEFDTSTSP